MKRASLFAGFVRLLLFSLIFFNLLPVIGITVTQQHQLTASSHTD